MSSLPLIGVPRRPTLVCVVDGDARVRRRLEKLLERLGAEVRSYATAGEFLASLATAEPACVVADAALADLNGRELLAELRARGLSIPTVLLSGDADIASAVGAIRAGAVDFIEKPYIDRALVGHVSAILGLDDRCH
jgi:two-component system response regulator FixJ